MNKNDDRSITYKGYYHMILFLFSYVPVLELLKPVRGTLIVDKKHGQFFQEGAYVCTHSQ